MSLPVFLKLQDYNEQTTARILEHALRLSAEQFQAESGYTQRNLQGLLAHTLRTETIWRTLSKDGQIKEKPRYEATEYPDVPALQKAWAEEDRLMRTELASLDEDQLSATIPVTDWNGNVYPMIRWQMLLHRYMHSMQHRTEAAAILTGFGYSPGDLDLLFFL